MEIPSKYKCFEISSAELLSLQEISALNKAPKKKPALKKYMFLIITYSGEKYFSKE